MLSSYVCRQCTLRLSRRVAQVRNPQWQRRATFITLRSKEAKNDAEPTEPEGDEPHPRGHAHTSQGSDVSNKNIQNTSKELRSPNSSAGRYAQYVQDNGTIGSWDQETPSDGIEHAKEVGKKSDTRKGFATSIRKALQLRRAGNAWRLFEEAYTSADCKALSDPPSEDIELLRDGKIFADLLKSIRDEFCRGQSDLPVTPTGVLFRYEQLGLARPQYWTKTTLDSLTHQVILAINCPDDKPKLDLSSLLFELLSVWRLFFQFKGGQSDSLTEIGPEWRLPAIESISDTFRDTSFSQRLQLYHPKHPGDGILGFCAIYLYTISDALSSVEALEQQAAPLLQFLERLLAGSYVGGTLRYLETSYMALKLPPEVQEQIRNEIMDTPRKALMSIAGTGAIDTGKTEETRDAAINLEESFLKMIARAIETAKSVPNLKRKWLDVEKEYIQIQKITVPIRIYNSFLVGFMALDASEQSVLLWNHMIANGVKPNMQSWVALLNGCTKTQDSDGLNNIWKRLLSTGQEPDNYAWTARVHGLFATRQINSGLAALDEMGQKWLSAEAAITQSKTKTKNRKAGNNPPKPAKVVNNYTKPSVEVVNGAISGVMQMRLPNKIRVDRMEHVHKILGWARHFDIQPDVRTYNILIQLHLNVGDTKAAFKVIRQMEKDGIEGDVATYTILVSAMFFYNRLQGLSEAEQTKRVLSLFEALESTGIKLNNYLYAASIDKFLKHYGNFTAVQALIDHMVKRNLVPTVHVYSSLITHYFQLEPPAIEAVNTLVTQLLTNPRMPGDRVMFDRVLEGFAQYGEVDKMVKTLERMKKKLRFPGWRALRDVVVTLVQSGDVERARTIIVEVQRGEGVTKGEFESLRREKDLFFQTVKGLGIGLEEHGPSAAMPEDGPMETSEVAALPSGDEVHQTELKQQFGDVDAADEQGIHDFLVNDPEPEHQESHRV